MLPNIHTELVEQIVSGANIILPYVQIGTEYGSWRDGAWGWGFGFLWPVFWLFVLAALIGAVVYLLSHQTESPNADQAITVLRERYARGEIEEEEFEERASRLRNFP